MKGLPRLLALTCALAVMFVACGDGDDGAGPDAGATGVSIDEPADGAEVTVPFTLEFSGEGLGPPGSSHHVHVFYDGDESNYEVVEETSFEVTGLSSGEHTITVSLRNADHSAAGAEDEITVMVTDGDPTEEEGEDRGGYDY